MKMSDMYMSDGELVFFILNEAVNLTKSERNFLDSLQEKDSNLLKNNKYLDHKFLTKADKAQLKKLILKVPE